MACYQNLLGIFPNFFSLTKLTVTQYSSVSPLSLKGIVFSDFLGVVAQTIMMVGFVVQVYNHIQGEAKRRSPGLVNFVAAVAYHFCLALPAAFTQPGAHLLAEPCIIALL